MLLKGQNILHKANASKAMKKPASFAKLSVRGANV